jgi:anti-sigma B factor antagonist
MTRWTRFVTRQRRQVPPPAEPPTLEVRVEERGESARIELTGELDIDTRMKLKTAFASVEARRPKTIVVDLRRLEFMDSMGLGVLLGALRRSRTGGWRLVLVKGPAPIEQLLLITGVGNLVDVVDDPDAAGNGTS